MSATSHDEPPEPPPGRDAPHGPLREPADEHAELRDRARMSQDATFSDTDAPRAKVPGLLSGDIGPKGKVAAQLREVSRTERSSHGEVPRGATTDGSGRYILLALLGTAFVLLGIAALLAWTVR